MSEKQIRVLLVDDEEELIEYLSKRLLREGFTVRAVTSGRLALETVEAEEFDVAVVDLKMPGMDGIEVQRLIKQKRPFLQTVVLTGHGSLQTALESGRQDAFRFLQKPADHGELVQALREAAAEKERQIMARFREEMQEIASSGASPRDIVVRVDALRRKFGLS
ncbi:MAG: response regulator [Deltaproteobacteria bacterium]|nr:response regulator [Deltaproteobacteria bacterium]